MNHSAWIQDTGKIGNKKKLDELERTTRRTCQFWKKKQEMERHATGVSGKH